MRFCPLLCKGNSKVCGIEGERREGGVYHTETGKGIRNLSWEVRSKVRLSKIRRRIITEADAKTSRLKWRDFYLL